MKKGKKKKIIISIIGVIIVLGGVLGYMILGNPSIDQDTDTKPTMGSIVNDNRFTGVIDTQAREDLMATQSLEIYDLYVSEGDQVEKDTDLYQTYSGQVVSATISGEVSKIYYNVDDTVPAGGKIMDIADYTNLQVTIKVDEYQLSSISVGSPVTINVDSIGRSVQGT
ncbi:MAG: HlyD family secretion protein, partial [Eubacteriaceae bacterium]|nr:HlyD family secretion protein [Eubacteriaceae bacterium]